MTRWFGSLIVLILALPGIAHAGNVSITGGSNGPNCNSGGYFTPSSITLNSGDTLTISVPSNDPYSGGIQVHGFPEGNFTILPGSSHTTQSLTTNVSFYATWPNLGCTKGSGNITISAPATPTPTVASTPVPVSTTSTTHTTTSGSKTPTPTPQLSASPSPSTSASASPTTSVSPTPSPSGVASPIGASTSSTPPKTSSTLVLAASAGGAGLVIILGGVGAWWLFKRKMTPPLPTSTSPLPPQTPDNSQQ